MWLFSLLDPFIPTQIKFLTTPLAVALPQRCPNKRLVSL